MGDPVQDYLVAKAQLDDTTHRITKTGQLVYRAGEALMGSPPRLVVQDGEAASVPVPAGQTFWLDPGDWPSVDALKAALRDYQSASRRAHELYEQLSPEVRVQVQAPGDKRAV
jgi:hypothetical protein